MKKLILTLSAILFISFVNFAQSSYKNTDKVSTSVKLTAKFHSVITLLETKEFYHPGMTENDFIEATTSCLEDQELKEIFVPYMSKIYGYHVQKLSSDQVYDLVDGNEFSKVATNLRNYQDDPDERLKISLKKPRWFNWLRKLIDFIDDTWK